MICPNCRNELPVGNKFCTFCGASLLSAPAEEETPAPAEEPAPEAAAVEAGEIAEEPAAGEPAEEQPLSHRAQLEAQLRKELGLVREGKADGNKDFASLFGKKRK